MSTLTIMYSTLFKELSSPWKEEKQVAEEIGLNTITIEEDTLKINSESLKDCLILYRGWMMSYENYIEINKAVEKKGGRMIVSPNQFNKVNKFSPWYEILKKHTMESYFIKDFELLDDLFKTENEYFIKDNLKSLGSEKSIAKSKEEAIQIYDKILNNRDFEIKDNGMCLRKVVPIENEERYFVINSKVLGNHKNKSRIKLIEKISETLLSKIGLAFFSIDIGTSEGKDIIIELGGLQVSDMNKEGDIEKIKDCYIEIKKEIEKML